MARWVMRNGELIPIEEAKPVEPTGPFIMRDIKPYKAVATDIDGSVPVITSRSKHKEFLKRNGYQELGNEMPKSRPKPMPGVREDLINALRRKGIG